MMTGFYSAAVNDQSQLSCERELFSQGILNLGEKSAGHPKVNHIMSASA